MWSGHDKDRNRDFERNGAECIKFCDTDFRHSKKLSCDDVLVEIATCKKHANIETIDFIVLTGGEPALQVDVELLDRLFENEKADVAIETNGTVPFKEGVGENLDWVCVSPKSKDDEVVIREGDELKVVFPNYNPMDFSSLAEGFKHRLVQPCAETTEVGKSRLSTLHLEQCVEFCMKNPKWCLSMQTHKILGLP